MRESMATERSARRPREFWTALVHQWEASGVGQQSVADAAGVNVHTLRYWIEKHRAERQSVPAQSKGGDFVEVSSASATTHSAAVACRIHVGKRVVLELSALPPIEWLRALSNEA